MKKVLLVEDNKLALEYLKTLIDWNSCGFEIAATALDGEEGLKRYCTNKPQLVITDIQMPVMSGIDLAEKIRELDKDVKIIFLSSYQEFDYVRSALKFGVTDYIIKHELDEASLIKKLSDIRMMVDDSRSIKRLKFEKNIVENILSNSIAVKWEVEDMYLNSKAFSMVAVERDHPLDVFQTMGDWKSTLIEESDIKKVCYEVDEKVSGVVHIKDDLYLLLISEQSSNKSANDFAYELKSKLEKNLTGSFSVFIMGEHLKLEECGQKYNDYKEMNHYRYFTKRSIVINSIFIESSITSHKMKFDQDLVCSALEKGEIDPILKFMDSSYIDIIRNRDYASLSIFTEKFIYILKDYCGKVLGLKDGKHCTFLKEQEEDSLYTTQGIWNFLREKFIELIGLLSKDKEREFSTAVKVAIRFISKNYENVNLSAEDIADHVGLSINRLGDVFKKETHHTIRSYLNFYRIEKSKELIQKGLKMYQIHNEVGYLTSQYFSKVFRKVTGVTPMEFKRGEKNESII